MADEVMVYIGTRACGHTTFICVDKPAYRKSTAKDVADAIGRGLSMERVPLEEGKRRLKRCDCGEC